MDTGGAEAEYIEERFGDNPIVADVTVEGHTKLPWSPGNVSGVIVTEPDAGEEEVTALAREIGEFQENTTTGSNADNLRIDVDGVTARVVPDEAEMDRKLALIFGLRDDVDVLAATMDIVRHADISRISITVTGPEVVQDVARRWQDAPGELYRPAVGAFHELTITTEEEDYLVDGLDGPWWESGFEAWNAVAEDALVTSVKLKPQSLEMRVADDADIDAARERSQEIVGPDMRVTVSGGILNIAEGADGATGRAVINGLPENARELLTGAATNDVELAVGVVDVPAMRTVSEALMQNPETAEFRAIRIGTPDFEVAAAPDELMDWIGHFEDLRTNTGATTIHLDRFRGERGRTGQRFLVHFDREAPATDDEVVRIAHILRPLVTEPVGLSMYFGTESAPMDSALATGADPDIDAEHHLVERRIEASPQTDLFVRTWNEDG